MIQQGLNCVPCDPCPTDGAGSINATGDEMSINQALVDADYTHSAAHFRTMCAPAGNALALGMRASLTRDQVCTDLSCHPTKLLQYLNALVLYATITDTTPVGLGDGGTGYAGYTTLQNYAWNAYSDYKQREQAACTEEACVQFGFSQNTTEAAADTAQKDGGLSTECRAPVSLRLFAAPAVHQTNGLNFALGRDCGSVNSFHSA